MQNMTSTHVHHHVMPSSPPSSIPTKLINSYCTCTARVTVVAFVYVSVYLFVSILLHKWAVGVWMMLVFSWWSQTFLNSQTSTLTRSTTELSLSSTDHYPTQKSFLKTVQVVKTFKSSSLAKATALSSTQLQTHTLIDYNNIHYNKHILFPHFQLTSTKYLPKVISALLLTVAFNLHCRQNGIPRL